MKRLLVALAITNAGCGALIEEKEYVERRARALSALNCTTCAVMENDGSVWCWGANERDQLGHAGPSDGTPQKVVLDSDKVVKAKDVSVGTSHACAISEEGDVYCWGSNATGQADPNVEACPDPATIVDWISASFVRTALPTKVDLPRPATQVSAGQLHTCALLDDRTVRCWGSNHAGQCGRPVTYEGFIEKPENGLCGWTLPTLGAALCTSEVLGSAEPVQGLSGVDEIVVQRNTSCALMGTNVRCWGNNCGSGDPDGLKIQGILGNDCSEGGQLGIRPDERCFSDAPLTIGDLQPSKNISLGHVSGYAIGEVGADVLSWGWNDGQLGRTATGDYVVPASVELTGGGKLGQGKMIARCNGWHQLAQVKSGHVYSWGRNECGELGQSSVALGGGSPHASRADRIPSGATLLTSGQDHTCYVADGRVFCLGRGEFVGRRLPDESEVGDCGYEATCADGSAEEVPVEVEFGD